MEVTVSEENEAEELAQAVESAEERVVLPYERINHPKHYNLHPSGVECIDIVEHLGFNVGNAVKYLWRAGLKPGEETDADLKKALWYVNREIAKREKEKLIK